MSNLKDDQVEDELGIVVIGRNEGERLRRCLESAAVAGIGWSMSIPARRMAASPVPAPWVRTSWCWTCSSVFGGSGAQRGIRAVLADRPGCPAGPVRRRRLRTVRGLARARASSPRANGHEVAVVCGRLRERFPERTRSTTGWPTSNGIRTDRRDQGMRGHCHDPCRGLSRPSVASTPSIIAAEDDELCLRIRRRGWKIVRIDAEMAFTTWRCTASANGGDDRPGPVMPTPRGGHARPFPRRHFVRPEPQRGLLGNRCPARRLRPGLADPGYQPCLLAGYLILYLRIRRSMPCIEAGRRRTPASTLPGSSSPSFPQAIGLARYWLGRLTGQRSAVSNTGARSPD